MRGLNAQQILDIRLEAVEHIEVFIRRILFDQIGVIVLHLNPAICHVFGLGCFGGLIYNFRSQAVQRIHRCREGQGCIERFAVRQNPVARVQPEGFGLSGQHREGKVNQIAIDPQRVLDLYRDEHIPAVRRFCMQCWQIQHQTVHSPVVISLIRHGQMQKRKPTALLGRHSAAAKQQSAFIRGKAPSNKRTHILHISASIVRAECKPFPARVFGCHARLHLKQRDVADRLFDFIIGEGHRYIAHRFIKAQHRALAAFTAHSELLFHAPMNTQHTMCGAADLDLIEILIGDRLKCDLLAGNRIAVPIRQHEIVRSARQTGAIVHPGPRCLADAIAAFHPPTLHIPRIVDLDFAHMGERM